MAEIYILNVADCESELLSLLPYISEARQRTVNGLRHKKASLFSIASEAVLAHALSLPLPCEYMTDQNGKPYICGCHHFNISHSGDFVVCAVSDYEIGVDTEVISRMSPHTMHKFLSPSEINEYNSLTQSRQKAFLCEKWVRKESYLKLLGTGLRKSPASLCFEGDRLTQDSSVFCRCFSLSDDQLLAASSKKELQITIHHITKDNLNNLKVK